MIFIYIKIYIIHIAIHWWSLSLSSMSWSKCHPLPSICIFDHHPQYTISHWLFHSKKVTKSLSCRGFFRKVYLQPHSGTALFGFFLDPEKIQPNSRAVGLKIYFSEWKKPPAIFRFVTFLPLEILGRKQAFTLDPLPWKLKGPWQGQNPRTRPMMVIPHKFFLNAGKKFLIDPWNCHMLSSIPWNFHVLNTSSPSSSSPFGFFLEQPDIIHCRWSRYSLEVTSYLLENPQIILLS